MKRDAGNFRLQGAIEYLTTYGWAILIIVAVLGAIYGLGLFGGGGAIASSSCLATPGFLCSSPVLNVTGMLGVQFGQISSGSITLTGVGCSNSTAPPSSTQSVNQKISSGTTTGIVFTCPLRSNSLGTPFTGTLWIVFTNSAGQGGIVQELGSVSAKVATTANAFVLAGAGAGSGGGGLSFSATCGGTLSVVSGNDICTFTSSGTFTVTGASGNVAVLVVGGGGAGGASSGSYSGGGGAGGLVENDNFILTAQTYPVTVGTGGSGTAPGSLAGADGTASSFNSITAAGGGGGACGGQSYCGRNGGSGGGGGNPCTSPGSGTTGEGNGGGSSSNDGGGGGGAGSVGSNAPGAGFGGAGGAGKSSSLSGSSAYYAGGGGGFGPSGGGAGGIGGGATIPPGSGSGNPGTANTGGGGSGSESSTTGSGGSGIVIIAYNALGNGNP